MQFILGFSLLLEIQAICNQIVTRPEIRDLSPQQLRTFIRATQQLRNVGGMDQYQSTSQIHFDYQDTAHGVPAFFPWHREYIRRYELELQRIDSSIILPYWDWSRDSQSPERSPILSSGYFGGNGRTGDYCVMDGPFAGWNTTVPNVHCLKRQYDGGNTISSLYSPEAMEVVLTQAFNYDQLRQTVEGAPHARVHVSIGGTEGDLSFMYSSNDPIFFLHHVFIDLIWHEWQLRNPSLSHTYNGNINGRNVTASDNLLPFNIPVNNVFDTQADGYCYTYARYGSSLPSIPISNNNSGPSSIQNQNSGNLDQNSQTPSQNIGNSEQISGNSDQSSENMGQNNGNSEQNIQNFDQNSENLDQNNGNSNSPKNLIFNPSQNQNFIPSQNQNFNPTRNSNFNPSWNTNFIPFQNSNFNPSRNSNFGSSQGFNPWSNQIQNFRNQRPNLWGARSDPSRFNRRQLLGDNSNLSLNPESNTPALNLNLASTRTVSISHSQSEFHSVSSSQGTSTSFSSFSSSSSSILGPLADFNKQDILPLDRQTINKIRACDPIPDGYLQRNKINSEFVRNFEAKIHALVGIFNTIPDFVPAAHLIA